MWWRSSAPTRCRLTHPSASNRRRPDNDAPLHGSGLECDRRIRLLQQRAACGPHGPQVGVHRRLELSSSVGSASGEKGGRPPGTAAVSLLAPCLGSSFGWLRVVRAGHSVEGEHGFYGSSGYDGLPRDRDASLQPDILFSWNSPRMHSGAGRHAVRGTIRTISIIRTIRIPLRPSGPPSLAEPSVYRNVRAKFKRAGGELGRKYKPAMGIQKS